MSALGIGSMPEYTSTNISAIKKSMEVQEMSIAKLLDSASSQNVQLQAPSGGAKELAASATQRGVGLDVMA